MSTITRDQAKTYLGIALDVDTFDAEIDDVITQAESAVSRRCGPYVAVEVNERVDGGHALVLTTTPVISLTSVTAVGGSALTVGDLLLDDGVVERSDGGSFPSRRYAVVYQAGWGTDPGDVPDDLLLGTLELIRHLWDPKRRGGTARVAGSTASEKTANTVPGAQSIFPWRVEQLLANFDQAGIA